MSVHIKSADDVRWGERLCRASVRSVATAVRVLELAFVAALGVATVLSAYAWWIEAPSLYPRHGNGEVAASGVLTLAWMAVVSAYQDRRAKGGDR